MSFVRAFEDCTSECAASVGGKALGLGALVRSGFPVPSGFCLTVEAFDEHVAQNRLQARIVDELRAGDDVAAITAASRRIGELFESSELPSEIAAEVVDAYRALGHGQSVPVAVRSSATAEDTSAASFAGQQETYLWVRGEEVVGHVRRCWASLFTPQAIAYRRRLEVPTAGLGMAVVVQSMVDARAAGVMITLDPVTGDRSQVTLEAVHGLGVALVNGEVTPDRYAIDKVTLDIRSRSIATKELAYQFDDASAGVERTELPADAGARPALSPDEVVEVVRLAKEVERSQGCPQDIEWAIGSVGDEPVRLYLLQTRPETIWSNVDERSHASATSVMDRLVELMTRQAAAKPPGS